MAKGQQRSSKGGRGGQATTGGIGARKRTTKAGVPEKQESTKTGKRSSAQKEDSLRQVPPPEPAPSVAHTQGAFGKEGNSAAEEVVEFKERKVQRKRERRDRKAP